MARVMVWRGDRISDSAQAIRDAVRGAVLNNRSSTRVPRGTPLVINWGTTAAVAGYSNTRTLNGTEAVAMAINKRRAFGAMQATGVSIPPYWVNRSEVPRNVVVIARTILTGSQGEGIVVVRPEDALPEAPLYTRYIPKTHEYRVHVFNGSCICIQEKRKREGFEQTNNQKLIRNHDNGWNFVVEDIRYPNENTKQACITEAINAVRSLGLSFGAVDLVIARDGGEAYVLEVNTAPAVTSPTVLAAYREAIESYITGNT